MSDNEFELATSGAGGEGAGEKGKVFINRVSIRTPPFCNDRPALWFASLEAQFAINNISQELTKYNYAIAHLDTTCTREVEDIILDPPKDKPFTILKKCDNF